MTWREFEDWSHRLVLTERQGFELLRQEPDVEEVELDQITRNAVSEIFAKHLRGVMKRLEGSFRPAGLVTLFYSNKDPSQLIGESASDKYEQFATHRDALERVAELERAGKLNNAYINNAAGKMEWSYSEIGMWLTRARQP